MKANSRSTTTTQQKRMTSPSRRLDEEFEAKRDAVVVKPVLPPKQMNELIEKFNKKASPTSTSSASSGAPANAKKNNPSPNANTSRDTPSMPPRPGSTSNSALNISTSSSVGGGPSTPVATVSPKNELMNSLISNASSNVKFTPPSPILAKKKTTRTSGSSSSPLNGSGEVSATEEVVVTEATATKLQTRWQEKNEGRNYIPGSSPSLGNKASADSTQSTSSTTVTSEELKEKLRGQTERIERGGAIVVESSPIASNADASWAKPSAAQSAVVIPEIDRTTSTLLEKFASPSHSRPSGTSSNRSVSSSFARKQNKRLRPRALRAVVKVHLPSIAFFYVLPLSYLWAVFLIQTFISSYKMYVRIPSLPLEAFAPPPLSTSLSEWSPSGALFPSTSFPIPQTLLAKTIRRLTDTNVAVSVSRTLTSAWRVDESLRSHRGLVVDDFGNVFLTSSRGLIAYDFITGERRWEFNSLAASLGASGRYARRHARVVAGPLLALDPAALLTQPSDAPYAFGAGERRQTTIVYHATRRHLFAHRSDSTLLFKASTNVPAPRRGFLVASSMEGDDGDETYQEGDEDEEEEEIMAGEAVLVGGLVHDPYKDLVLGVTPEGWIFVNDRKTGKSMARPKRLPCARGRRRGTCVASQLSSVSVNRTRLFIVARARQAGGGEEEGESSAGASNGGKRMRWRRPRSFLARAASKVPGLSSVVAYFSSDEDGDAEGGEEDDVDDVAYDDDEEDDPENGAFFALYAVDVTQGELDERTPHRIRFSGYLETGPFTCAPQVHRRYVAICDAEGGVSLIHADTMRTLWSSTSKLFAEDGVSFHADALHRNPPPRSSNRDNAIVVAPDEENMAIYAKSARRVVKFRLASGGDVATLASGDRETLEMEQVWETSPIYGLYSIAASSRELRVVPGPTNMVLSANGMVVLGAEIESTNYLPYEGALLRQGVVMLDRENGVAVSFTPTREPVSFVCVGMDGSVFLQSAPSHLLSPRRWHLLSRAPPPAFTLPYPLGSSPDSALPTWRTQGARYGLERLSPPVFLPLLRESICASERRARNAIAKSCTLSKRGWLPSIPFASASVAAQILSSLGEESCREEAKAVSASLWQASIAYQIAHGSPNDATGTPNKGITGNAKREFNKKGGVDIAVGNAITSAIEVVNAGFVATPGDDGESASAMLEHVLPHLEEACAVLSSASA